jgi:ribulose-bisphosphate carboxylase large chain
MFPFCFRYKRLRVASPGMADGSIEAVYRVRTPRAALAARAEALLLEQTVELPRTALRSVFARERLVGRILEEVEVGPGDYRVTLSQPELAAAGDPAQLLNVLFGNCSLQPDILLEDVLLPRGLVTILGGPRFGIAGIRRLLGIDGRALTCSVLKPVGLSVEETASLCRTLAASGLDIVKDDHGHADPPFCPFGERVRACLAATLDAAEQTGRRTLYVPNVTGSPRTVSEHVRVARDLGVQAVMVSPMLIGLPFLAELAGSLGMPILAHPAFGGSLRISPRALLGRLFPLFGADAVIYPNYGGRFSFSRDECGAIAAALRAPQGATLPAFPVPAGGMRIENLQEVLGFYGKDTVLLMGGSLLDAPDAATVSARGRQLVEAAASQSYSP